eukprot:3011075-Prorocentrum_lima.AAC.1
MEQKGEEGGGRGKKVFSQLLPARGADSEKRPTAECMDGGSAHWRGGARGASSSSSAASSAQERGGACGAL